MAERQAFMTRRAVKGLAKTARKRPGEPLTADDWYAYWAFGAQPSSLLFKRFLKALPSTPRCGYCGAPFGGFGARVVRPLGYGPSRKNPNLCSVCVEMAPPGGMTAEIGVLFADVRGFTTLSEHTDPAEASMLLRRFYTCAEKVLFPEALIDKLIGDEVMALYLSPVVFHDASDIDDERRTAIADIMVSHARALLESVGYGSPEGPFLELGIGIDFGEAFIGNIGGDAANVHDFTAIGDVVNTAARLQGEAAGGEIVVADRLAANLSTPLGPTEQLALKGKAEPFAAHRVTWRV